MSNIGNHLRHLRNRAGLTQNQLANAIGLSGNSLISRIESGRVSPTPSVLNALAKFYVLDLEVFLSLTASEPHGGGILDSELKAMADDAARARARLDQTVGQLLEEFESHQNTLTQFMMASKLNLVWSLPRKLKRERSAGEVWILSPSLASETDIPQIRVTVESNLKRGVRYRYLIPAMPAVEQRAKALLTSFVGTSLEIRVAPLAVFEFAVETVIYDPGKARRMGLMVAPTRRPEFDIVLGAETAARFESSFARIWSESDPVEHGP